MVGTTNKSMAAMVWRMVAQEVAPALPSPGHVLGDGRLSDRKSELEQLTMNAWRTPKQILNAHPPDQHSQIRIDWRSASQGARFPTPIPAARSADVGARHSLLQAGSST